MPRRKPATDPPPVADESPAGTFDLQPVYHRLSFHGQPFYGLLNLHRAVVHYGLTSDPDYQRGHVWTPRQQALFLGHLLEGGTVLPLIVNTGAKGCDLTAELVDGKQRLTAGLAWAEGKIAAELSDGRTVRAAELDRISQRFCQHRIGLEFGLVRMSRREALEFYIRYNRGGTVHTDAEIDRVRALLAAAPPEEGRPE